MWRKLERTMKQIALDQEDAPVRRFDPDRDGYWDGYSYDIDNAFPEVAAQVERHRASAESGEETLWIVGSDHESLP